jgi:hypothetical protein
MDLSGPLLAERGQTVSFPAGLTASGLLRSNLVLRYDW